jgi:hypothetical protein
MSALQGRFAGPAGTHPVVASRRRRHAALLVASALIPLAVAMGISVSQANGSILLWVGLVIGVVGTVVLIAYPRLEISVLVVMLYLGLLDGPVKLGSGGHESASVVRDVAIYAVATGALLRLIVRKESIKLPPLAGWALAWGMLVLVEALNPNTHGLTKALGGFRQQLEWVPFFFFGYALIRSKRRFRQYFIVIGVIALANGIVGTYQTTLSPSQLASWGPGYREFVFGSTTPGQKGGFGARVARQNGETRVRPPGLGSDAGGGAGWGARGIALVLALLSIVTLRRRWLYMLMVFGALAGVATGQGRLQVVGAVLIVLLYAGLSLSGGRKMSRPVVAILTVVVLAIPIGAVFASALGSNTFNRYSSIAPGNISTETKDTKTSSLKEIPNVISQTPFGVGLGSVGASTGFGGVVEHEGIESHSVSAETQYNFVVDELGLPGLILWVALTIRLLSLGLARVRKIRDTELRAYLTALLATLIGMTLIGFSGPTMSSAAWGPFFWSTAGIFAYWFITVPTRSAERDRLPMEAVPA